MKRTVAGFATGVFAVVAITTAPLAAASPEDDFLDALAVGGLTFPARAAQPIAAHGHLVCQGFATGDSYTDAVADAALGLGGNRGLGDKFVRAAISTLCPKYIAELL